MGRSQETAAKKDRENKRKKKQQDKLEKMKERKAGEKSKSPGIMLAYLDENGDLTDSPPDPKKKKSFRLEDIEVSVPKLEDRKPDPPRKGTVTFFNTQKGFGFINDSQTRERIFVHANDLSSPIQENDKVTFLINKTPKGPVAFNVTVVK